VLVCLVVFLPQFVLVHWGPRLLGTVLSKQLQTSVTVEGVAGGWWSGAKIRGLEVAESPEPQAPLLLCIERITLNLALVWLLGSSTPIVLRLEDVTVNSRCGNNGQWNLAALPPWALLAASRADGSRLGACRAASLALVCAGGPLPVARGASAARWRV